MGGRGARFVGTAARLGLGLGQALRMVTELPLLKLKNSVPSGAAVRALVQGESGKGNGESRTAGVKTVTWWNIGADRNTGAPGCVSLEEGSADEL